MYCNPTDLIALLPESTLLELADDTGSASWADVAVQQIVADAITAATMEIDSVVGVRYPVPLTPCPPMVRDWCARLSIASLWLRRPGGEDEAPVRWQREGDRVRKVLSSVAVGDVVLGPLTAAADPAEFDDDGPIIVTPSRRFSSRY